MGLVKTTATISPDGRYRYDLTRTWGTGPRAVWIMLNPSTADAEQDDPTIRRCIAFSKREGHGCIAVVNRFAARTTRPVHLLDYVDPVGPDNARHVKWWIHQAPTVIAAWGAHPIIGDNLLITDWCQEAHVPLMCLGITADGSPRHPLYVKGDTPLQPWPAEKGARECRS